MLPIVLLNSSHYDQYCPPVSLSSHLYWWLSVYCAVLEVFSLTVLYTPNLTTHNPSQMGLSPVYRVSDGGEGVTKVRANRQAQGAVTQYRVLDSSNGCSLVELQPITGRDTTEAYSGVVPSCWFLQSPCTSQKIAIT